MDNAIPLPPDAARSIIEALLIGFLIGAQREASHGERHPGVRDFVLIGLTGGICGLLQRGWLTAAALASLTALLAVYYFHIRERTGITTEIAAVAAFALGFLVATPANPLGAPLAIGTTVVVVAFLEAKRSLHKLLRETITEAEFNDTLLFLALIFVIYPVLPDGAYGPYGFFAPRKIWLFVILVSSISYSGYFLEKFLGATRGLKLAGVFGGLASTTAATASFARACAEEAAAAPLYAQAAVIANAVQFPRVLAILLVVSPDLARASLPALAAMGASGLLFGWLMQRTPGADGAFTAAGLRNPFRIVPALKFGVIFGLILLAGKAAVDLFGGGAVYLTSIAAGSLDVDAVAVTAADLVGNGSIGMRAGALSVILALAANAVVKAAIAATTAGGTFTRKLVAAFGIMFAAGLGVWVMMPVAGGV